jgi:hypothetical protein
VPDDLLASPIEPVGNREGSTLGGGRGERGARPAVRRKASEDEPEPLETIGAAEPHELDEMA